MEECDISKMLGQTCRKITFDKLENELYFETDVYKFKMYHYQDCCERVYLEDVCGDLNDLIGNPILQAECVTNSDNPPPDTNLEHLWTFYKLSTIKGSVTLRWSGTSNGYYSVAVNFEYRKFDNKE